MRQLLHLGVAAGLIMTPLAVACGRGDGGTITTLAADIASACGSANKVDGFAMVVLDRDLEVVGEDTTVLTPCVVYLADGAHLAIRRTLLRSANLVITDDRQSLPSDAASLPPLPPEGTTAATSPSVPARLSIEDSTLSAVGSAGLFVRFVHSGGSIAVRHSRLDYPSSITLATSNSDTTGTSNDVVVSDSTLRSVGPDTAGISVAAAGAGEFVAARFETTANEGYAMLVADRCHQRDVTGAIGSSCFPRPGD